MVVLANPPGAEQENVQRLSAFLKQQAEPEPQGQPEGRQQQERAPVAANPPSDEQPAERQLEAQNLDDQPIGEPETVETAEQTEHEGEQTELANSVAGLAEQLGMNEEELLDHIGMTVKVGGEEKRVNLRELKNGHQFEADYRRKTAKLADDARAFEAERQQYQQQREHLTAQLTPLVQQLEASVVDDEQRIQQFLNEGDLLEAQKLQFQSQQKRSQLEAAQREQQRIAAEKQHETRAQFERDVLRNEERLAELRPEWVKDIEKGRRELAAVRQFLKDEGVPAKQADDLYDATSITIAYDAMRYRQLLKERPLTLQQVRQAPKVFQKPGPIGNREDPQIKVRRADLNRLRKTGSTRDLASVLKSQGFVR